MRFSRLIACIAVAAAVGAACGSHSASQAAEALAGPTSTSKAVPTQLQFTAKTLAGQNFSGESLLGKPAVLWFWAPWCPVCQGEAASVGQIATTIPP